jgi:hypothetical protein
MRALIQRVPPMRATVAGVPATLTGGAYLLEASDLRVLMFAEATPDDVKRQATERYGWTWVPRDRPAPACAGIECDGCAVCQVQW